MISSVVRGTLDEQNEFFRAHIPSSYFRQYGREISFLLKHYEKHGKSPDKDTFKSRFPDFKVLKTTEPLAYYVDSLCAKADMRKVRQLQADLSKLYMEPGFTSVNDMRDLIQKSSESFRFIHSSSTVDFNDTGVSSIEYYEKQVLEKKSGKSTKIYPPYKSIVKNRISAGNGPQDLVVLYGYTGVGKTWYQLMWAISACMQGFPTFFMSKEMSVEELKLRIESILFEMDYPNIVFGTLNKKEKRRWRQEKENFRFPAPFILSDEEESNTHPQGIGFVESKIRQHGTYANFVDSAHLFFGTGNLSMVESAVRMARECKQIARRTKTVLNVSVQSNEDGTLNWVKNIKQDANSLIFISGDIDQPYRSIKYLKERNGQLGEVKVNFSLSPKVDLSELSLVNAISMLPDEETVEINPEAG